MTHESRHRDALRAVFDSSTVPVLCLMGFVGVVGCDSVGPLVDDPIVPEAEVEALIAVLDVYDSVLVSEPMDALREAGPALTETFVERPDPTLGPIAARKPVVRVPFWDPGLTRALAEAATNGPVALAGAALPSVLPRVAGVTYVYDGGVGHYVASTRQGAPGNGVRITLYQPRRNRVQEIGWLDVLEDGASLPNAYRVRARGIERGRLFADYSTIIVGPAGPGLLRPTAIGVDGQVIAGSELLQFDLESTVPDPFNPNLDLKWLFTLLNRGFSIEARASGVPPSGQGVENLDFFLLYRGWRWQVRYNDRGGQIDALVLANGRELAAATGTISQPTVVGRSGRTLSPRTRFLVIRLLLVVSGVFATYNDLFTPPAAVILQGL